MSFYYRVPGWWGNLGNNILQVSHAIYLAKKYNSVCTYPDHPFFEKKVFDFSDGSEITAIFDENNAGNFWQPLPRYTIDGQNYENDLFNKRSEILKNYVLSIFKAYKKLDYDYDLVINIRGGDIMTENGSPPQYVQAPLSYFLYVLEKENPEKVLLVCEDNKNPVIEKLKETKYNIDIHTDDDAFTDANNILNAKTYAIGGISTFSIVLAQMSENLERVYYPDFDYCLNNTYPEKDIWYRDRNLLGKMDAEVFPVTFADYIKVGEWGKYSVEEKKDLMINYPIDRLQISNLNNIDVLEINKFANLHDGEKIFFSALDHGSLCKEVLEEISKVDHDVILITGNSDYGVGKYTEEPYPKSKIFDRTNDFFDSIPKNVKHLFVQNSITRRDGLVPIPIGLPNGVQHFRGHHGNGSVIAEDYNDRLKTVFISDKSTPRNFLYLNYGLRPYHREKVTNLCETYLKGHFTYNHKDLHYDTYLSHILDHECVLCPVGIGVDTYRLYETLYCKRIPITINVSHLENENYEHAFIYESIFPQKDDYPIYTDLYSKLPVVVLNDYEELKDINHLKKLVEEQKNKKWDRNLLDFNYWKKMILDLSINL